MSSRTLLAFLVFAAGAALMALEILAFRVVGKTFGSALRETSVVISVFLLTMTAGYYIGGRTADARPRFSLLAIVFVLAGLSSLSIPWLDDMVSERVFQSALPISFHALVVALTLFSVPAFLLATVGPIAVRLELRSTESAGRTSGMISALSAAGSIVGSLGAAFVLIDWFRGVSQAIFAIGWTLLVCSLLALAPAVPAVRWRAQFELHRKAALAVLALVIGLIPIVIGRIYASAPGEEDHQERATRNRVLYERTTRYHNIVVRELDRRWRTLYFGLFPQSEMDLRDPHGPGFEYVDFAHVPRVLMPEVRRVLFIGLGGGSGPKQFLADCPECQVDAVEIDQAVVDVAGKFFALPVSGRLRVSVEDGRTFLRRSNALYDVVFIDAFTTNRYGITIPWHLTTEEFFRELSERMTPGGHVVFNSPTPPSSNLTRALGKTLALSFPYQMYFRMERGTNTIIVASRVDTRRTATELMERVRAARDAGRVRYPPLERRASQLLERNPSQLGVAILTDNYAPIDLLIRESQRTGEREAAASR